MFCNLVVMSFLVPLKGAEEIEQTYNHQNHHVRVHLSFYSTTSCEERSYN